MSAMFEFDAASANQESGDVLMKDISGAMERSEEAERAALAQQAANEALTLQQFSTLDDEGEEGDAAATNGAGKA
ncbi:hypothetical protein H072_9812 [Dactylellina haptotyla CBS 200.50]|nr:hypothetical protein H072_9812 [Dactylellina haptotyla CBS 200.50]